MATTSQLNIRRVVPRWRPFRTALKAGELDPTEVLAAKGTDGEGQMRKKEAEWKANRELAFATDLVGAAQVFGITEIAKEAADFVLSNGQRASPLARAMAATVLGLPEVEVTLSPGSNRDEFLTRTRTGIVELKSRRITEPRNAFVWADLARLYVLLGLMEPAAEAMRVALALAPSDRFIIRVATRFFLHAGDPERALHLLRSTERTARDPWLMSAELAVSAVAEKKSKFAKKAEDVLHRGGVSPFHTSELAASLASLEMWNGKHRSAKRRFSDALVQPTENALAQAVWAEREVGLPPIEINRFTINGAAEARSLAARNSSEWPNAFEHARLWAREEPFSARPYAFASSVGTSILGRAVDGEEIARAGLHTNPGHPGLINNVAFALAEQDNPQLAAVEIKRADTHLGDDTARICLIATEGLIEFRLGNVERGKELYEKAMVEAQQAGEPSLKALAQVYLAREEARVGHAGFGQLFERGATAIAKNGTTQSAATIHRVHRQIVEFAAMQGRAEVPSAPIDIETQAIVKL